MNDDDLMCIECSRAFVDHMIDGIPRKMCRQCSAMLGREISPRATDTLLADLIRAVDPDDTSAMFVVIAEPVQQSIGLVSDDSMIDNPFNDDFRRRLFWLMHGVGGSSFQEMRG